jgi:hypothetical protein
MPLAERDVPRFDGGAMHTLPEQTDADRLAHAGKLPRAYPHECTHIAFACVA